jgi:hypothetical protein
LRFIEAFKYVCDVQERSISSVGVGLHSLQSNQSPDLLSRADNTPA